MISRIGSKLMFLHSKSINLQHFLWVAQFGYITHPKVPVGDGGARIADVGTGTG